jgi:hypothetical protein
MSWDIASQLNCKVERDKSSLSHLEAQTEAQITPQNQKGQFLAFK